MVYNLPYIRLGYTVCTLAKIFFTKHTILCVVRVKDTEFFTLCLHQIGYTAKHFVPERDWRFHPVSSCSKVMSDTSARVSISRGEQWTRPASPSTAIWRISGRGSERQRSRLLITEESSTWSPPAWTHGSSDCPFKVTGESAAAGQRDSAAGCSLRRRAAPGHRRPEHNSHETVPLKWLANQRQRVRETAQQAAHHQGEQHLVTASLAQGRSTFLMRLSHKETKS